ncbi:hypothetical protein NP493_92g00030 [Ridgeia piscesae]|uniref:Uncharacterized protein n=1 Tax=Ridgeia piscesae TaxID=27915 RepID=A0AAD9P846_RIDPI|nr:hypothetical protein NP493_92g00030 [Ridgeia piscesae]
MDQCMLFDTATKKWEEMAPPITARYYHRSVSLGGSVYVVGGKRCTLSDMPMKCSCGVAVTLNDFIFVVRGFSRTCLKYDPASDARTRLNRPRQGHGNASAVVWRGSILLAAGNDIGRNPSSVELFDPLTNIWSNSNIAQPKEK